jgi:hypothetical protein
MSRSPSTLVAQLDRLLQRIRRHLELRLGPANVPAELTETAILWPGEDDHVVLLQSGAGLLEKVRELVQQQQRSALRWRADTFELITDHAIERLGRGQLTTADAAQVLASLSAVQADPRSVLVNVHGVEVQAPLDLCGVTFHPAKDRRRIHETVFALDVPEQFVQMRISGVPVGDSDAVALVRVEADDQMAALNARLRILIALCVLHAAGRTNDPLRVHPEYTSGIARTEHSSFLEARVGQPPQSYRWTNLQLQPLRADAATLSNARTRPGIGALERLAQQLPVMPGGSRVERVLRAAQLLGRSLDGDPDDRFLRRWMALEALVNAGRTRIMEQVVTRSSWLLFGPAERAQRERWFEQMYDRRSRLAHGSIDRTPFDFDAVEFGWLAFDALERVAALETVAEIEAVYTPMGPPSA